MKNEIKKVGEKGHETKKHRKLERKQIKLCNLKGPSHQIGFA
jgi:hypothetical protein